MSVKAQGQDCGDLKRDVVREPNSDSALNNATTTAISSLGITIGGDSIGTRQQSLISA
jgi:hypothetical protein